MDTSLKRTRGVGPFRISVIYSISPQGGHLTRTVADLVPSVSASESCLYYFIFLIPASSWTKRLTYFMKCWPRFEDRRNGAVEVSFERRTARQNSRALSIFCLGFNDFAVVLLGCFAASFAHWDGQHSHAWQWLMSQVSQLLFWPFSITDSTKCNALPAVKGLTKVINVSTAETRRIVTSGSLAHFFVWSN